MIEVRDVSKSFGRFEALHGVSFSARDGEITGLIGPNGAGKTTTLRVLYTVLKPDTGSATIDGFDTTSQRREVQRRIGVLPDNRGLYPRLTAREHIRYYGRLHGLSGAHLEQRIDALVRQLGMEDIADRRTKGFSKGQTMKVALARALVHEPHNVMFDEPTNGLDIASSRAVRDLVLGIRDAGRCVLFCSHIMSEVEALCDRIVVIAHGRVVADGTPAELRHAVGRADLEEVFLETVEAGS
ncbi:MAG: ATP-binding cassette domain-containing protein [Alphaproteobacteria bacterium]|jgi:sodium transport system ATP-binding protein|nr:ATP-binding cassette domain-containing protein [Alphaproteobacteria bacterium]